MQDFKELKVWEKAHELTLKVYAASAQFPKEEIFSLTNQMRRSSASVPTNIAEGCGRESPAELANFLRISMGSASELEYQLLLARDLGYLPNDLYSTMHAQVCEVKRMLTGLIRKITVLN
jgi:four helix bundle protein